MHILLIHKYLYVRACIARHSTWNEIMPPDKRSIPKRDPFFDLAKINRPENNQVDGGFGNNEAFSVSFGESVYI